MLLAAALAQGPLEMTTAYPSVVSDPGATAKFPITVTTDTPQRVNLSVSAAPDGWTTRLRGAGSTVSAVTTEPSTDTTSTLISGTFTTEVDVPADVQPGDYQVVVTGTTTTGTSIQLPLDISVQAEVAGAITMTTDYPSLKGPTSTNFRFNLTLTNDSNQQVTFGLETDAPAGWIVTAEPSGESQATTATVDAGSDAQVTVTAKAPTDTPAGVYDIVARAVGGPQPVETPLQVEITGTYTMSVSTTDGRLNARVQAGSPTVLNVVVTNEGSTDLTGVNLTSTPPRDWQISFDPSTIDTLPGGQQVTIPATITAANNALAGDYVITITARASENSTSDSMDIRTTVETSPIGYIIGIAILVLVAVGLFFVFQRYGRR